MYILNNKCYTKRELIQELIRRGQVKEYGEVSANFRREVRPDELPDLYITKAGYVYVVVKKKKRQNEIKTKRRKAKSF